MGPLKVTILVSWCWELKTLGMPEICEVEATVEPGQQWTWRSADLNTNLLLKIKWKCRLQMRYSKTCFKSGNTPRPRKRGWFFFPYQLGLLSFFQNMSSLMEVLWIKILAKGIKQKAWNRKKWSSKDLKGVREKAKRKRNLKENSESI